MPNFLIGTSYAVSAGLIIYAIAGKYAGAPPETVVGVSSGHDQKDNDDWCKFTITWTTED